MKVPFAVQLKPLLAQVHGNPRLQAGLALIGLLLLGWIVLALGDLREAQVAEREQARQRYYQVRQLVGQDVWLQRADEARQLADALDAEIPQAQSPGLAQAAFQGWLKQIVDSQGGELRLEVEAPVHIDGPGNLVRVTAMISGGMEPRRTWQMIHRIESSMSLVTIPVLTVRTDGANKIFSITVQGFYRLPATPRDAQP